MKNLSNLELSSKFSSAYAFQAVNFNRETLQEVEQDLLQRHDLNNIYDLGFFDEARERAAARWACIRSKSQREEKKTSSAAWKVSVFGGVTEIKPVILNRPAWAAPDRSGRGVNKFSKKSRRRLLQKMRRVNREKMNLPFFITLTYHKNYRDPKGSKKHLNRFLMKIRRHCEAAGCADRFAYVWKMEPQERGAVHFHLAMWIPEPARRYQVRNDKVREFKGGRLHTYKGKKALFQLIQRSWAWAHVEIDGIQVNYSDIKYRRKDGSTAGITKKMIIPGVDNLLYGTQVRAVDSWAQFMGYISKYIGKETHKETGEIKGMEDAAARAPWMEYRLSMIGKDPYQWQPLINYRPPARLKKYPKETGRFWGTSNNLDIEILAGGMIDDKDLHSVKLLATELNNANYSEKLKQYDKYLSQLKKNRPKKYKAERVKAYKYLRKIAGRYEINKEKISLFKGVQFDVDHKAAERVLKGRAPLRDPGHFFKG